MEWDSGKLSGGENQWLERELYELRSRVQQQEQLVPPTVQLGQAATV